MYQNNCWLLQSLIIAKIVAMSYLQRKNIVSNIKIQISFQKKINFTHSEISQTGLYKVTV